MYIYLEFKLDPQKAIEILFSRFMQHDVSFEEETTNTTNKVLFKVNLVKFVPF